MTVAVDDLMECITVEICCEKMKSITVSCIYRSPGLSIEVFRDQMESMFRISTQKVMYICGDFNIDLINQKKQKMTEEFINSMLIVSNYYQTKQDHFSQRHFNR